MNVRLYSVAFQCVIKPCVNYSILVATRVRIEQWTHGFTKHLECTVSMVR